MAPPRSSLFCPIALCLLSAWLLYGGLELAEELRVLVKVQPCAQDLDMEALAKLASGLKPETAAREGRPMPSETAACVAPASSMPTDVGTPMSHAVGPPGSPFRSRPSLCVYRL